LGKVKKVTYEDHSRQLDGLAKTVVRGHPTFFWWGGTLGRVQAYYDLPHQGRDGFIEAARDARLRQHTLVSACSLSEVISNTQEQGLSLPFLLILHGDRIEEKTGGMRNHHK